MDFILYQYTVAIQHTSKIIEVAFWSFVGFGVIIVVCMIITYINTNDKNHFV